MKDLSSNNLLPTENEARAILSVAQTDPTKLPAIMLRVQIARLVSIMFERLSKKLISFRNPSIKP